MSVAEGSLPVADVASFSAVGGSGSAGEVDPRVEELFSNPVVKEIVNQVKWAGFGGVCGYCTGVVTKRVGKQIALYLGAAFVSLQALSYFGYIEAIRYDKMEKDAAQALDLNADGKLDEHDVKIATSRVYKVLVHQVPSAAGFGAGLWFGLRS